MSPQATLTQPCIDSALMPSDDDVAFFKEHGWWMSQPIYSHEELDCALELQERLYGGDRPHPMPKVFPGNKTTDKSQPAPKPDPAAMSKDDWSCFILPELQIITHKPILAAMAARLMGSDEVRLWHDQLLCKPPQPQDRDVHGQSAVGWHADRNYWQTCSGPMVTAWVPFTEITPDMGPIAFLDRSQEWELIDDLDFFSDDLSGQELLLEKMGKRGKKVVPHFKRGQVSFHDWRTVHGSTPNLSDRTRRSMAVHLQSGENTWVENHDRDGQLCTHANDWLVQRDKNGNPDYRDSQWCPCLYPQNSRGS